MIARTALSILIWVAGTACGLLLDGQVFRGAAILGGCAAACIIVWLPVLRRPGSPIRRRGAIVAVVLNAAVAAVVAASLPGAWEKQRAFNRHRSIDMSNDGLVTVNFVDVFPHKFWISDWSSDSQYPGGFRYKVLSARREPGDVIQLVVVLQQRSGDKEVLSMLDVGASVFDRVAAKFVDGLTKQHGLDFEEQDFSSCRTLEAFDEQAALAGWSLTEPPDAG